MAASGPAAIAGLASPNVGGVVLKRHPLELEAARSLSIAKRIGRRLIRWAAQVEGKETELERTIGRDPDTGVDIRETVKDPATGEAIMVPILPDKDFLASWELYERSVRNLLQEQRHRATMGTDKGGQAMDDATFDAKIAELTRRAVLEMPKAELEALLRQRSIDVPAQPFASVDRTVDPVTLAGSKMEDPDKDPVADVLAGFDDGDK